MALWQRINLVLPGARLHREMLEYISPLLEQKLRTGEPELYLFKNSPDLYPTWLEGFSTELRFATCAFRRKTRKRRMRQLLLNSIKLAAQYRIYSTFETRDREILMAEVYNKGDSFATQDQLFCEGLARNVLEAYCVRELQQKVFHDAKPNDFQGMYSHTCEMLFRNLYKSVLNMSRGHDVGLEGSLLKHLKEATAVIEQRALAGEDLEYDWKRSDDPWVSNTE